MHHLLGRRSFLKSAAALPSLSLLPMGLSSLAHADGSITKRQKKSAVVRGAFFYPPAEVVSTGQFEDNWRHEKWFTYPGNQFYPQEQQAKFTDQVRTMTAELDLKLDIDYEMDLETGEIGLHATPIIADDVIVIGAAHLTGSRPGSRRNEKGYIRGYDAHTGERLWIFHTIPMPGECNSA